MGLRSDAYQGRADRPAPGGKSREGPRNCNAVQKRAGSRRRRAPMPRVATPYLVRRVDIVSTRKDDVTN
jgi:hypothetical protein